MGIIPKVDQPSPAFIHVDVDDLWAIAECYGYEVAEQWAHHVSRDALPRFARLFRDQNIKATFFVVGRDLKSPHYVELMRELLAAGHQAANHSYSHSLRFRAMSSAEMTDEVSRAHRAINTELNGNPRGFRAPGYAWSRQLLEVLNQQGYDYDASLMPGPYGGIFRWMDSRLQKSQAPIQPPSDHIKTQYPLLSDTLNSLYPAPVSGTRLIEIPSATSGLFRLPFQAGVCMRLGWPYFRANFEPYRWNSALPFVFLFHAADLADFSKVPGALFRNSTFFNSPVQDRYKLAQRFLQTVTATRPVLTTEDWLSK